MYIYGLEVNSTITVHTLDVGATRAVHVGSNCDIVADYAIHFSLQDICHTLCLKCQGICGYIVEME